MKDQLLTIVDAIRQAKAEINAYEAGRVKNAPRTLRRIEAILSDTSVSEAMGLLVPALADAPSVVPNVETEKLKLEPPLQLASAVSATDRLKFAQPLASLKAREIAKSDTPSDSH